MAKYVSIEEKWKLSDWYMESFEYLKFYGSNDWVFPIDFIKRIHRNVI